VAQQGGRILELDGLAPEGGEPQLWIVREVQSGLILRTNNGRESDFRDLNRRLLRTTGQKGLTRRILQREGAWELLPHPLALQDTIQALSHIPPQDFRLERLRVIQHRNRFRLHSRSAKHSRAQLNRLELNWAYLSNCFT
jgi:hypothetical protein